MIATIVCSMILLASIFDLQYSLLVGPFLDVLILMGLTILALIFSLILIPLNGSGKLTSYLPLGLLVAAFFMTFLTSKLNIGHSLHYHTNKENLEILDHLSHDTGIFKMTDMLRYQKRINDKGISNNFDYTTEEEIVNAFGDYLNEQNLAIKKVSELRSRLEKSNIISLLRTDDYLILTVDGFVDNEYGYVKVSSKKLAEGETLPPFGFVIVRLIDFGDGWYFFYTT